MNNRKINNNFIKYLPLLLLAVALIVGVTFALRNIVLIGNKQQIISSVGGNLTFSYIEGSNALNLTFDNPLSDDDGKSQANYFEFSVSAVDEEAQDINYLIYLTLKDSTNNIPENAVRLHLTQVIDSNEVEKVVPTTISELSAVDGIDDSRSIYVNTLTLSSPDYTKTHVYRLRAWINQSYNLVINPSSMTDDTGTLYTIQDYSLKFEINVKTYQID